MSDQLELAIRMEVEKKAFYENASEESCSKLGTAIFHRLAKEEDFHAAKAKEISDFLERGENPLAIEESLDCGKKLGTILKTVYKEDYFNFLKENEAKVWLNDPDLEEYPDSNNFPFETIFQYFQSDYFTNTISWLIAYAIVEGATTIGIWGVDMEADTEYRYQKPSVESMATPKSVVGDSPESKPAASEKRMIPQSEVDAFKEEAGKGKMTIEDAQRKTTEYAIAASEGRILSNQ